MFKKLILMMAMVFSTLLLANNKEIKIAAAGYPMNEIVKIAAQDLEKKGYVNRIVNETDKRVTYIKLTREGKDLINNIFPIHKKNTKKIFNDLTNGELITLKEILKKIN